MSNLVEIVGGDGTPPEPNWRSIFGRVDDRNAAAEYWRSIISEMRQAEKLAVVNAHSIKRLVVAYVTYDRPTVRSTRSVRGAASTGSSPSPWRWVRRR